MSKAVQQALNGNDNATSLGRVVVVSAEDWDSVWRRNQHFASRLIDLRLASTLTFVTPSRLRKVDSFSPRAGITVLTPRRWLPKRAGGLWLVAISLKLRLRHACDTLWINDAPVGARLRIGQRAAYDVTDDWREAGLSPRERRRLIRAERRLAHSVKTVVCSQELQSRWRDRYGVEAEVVPNAVDVMSIHRAKSIPLGERPNVGYVGTLHDDRLDKHAVLSTADALTEGQVHLVGPDCLSDATRSDLLAHPRVRIHGAVRSEDVPSWLASFDVLICPHRVTPFTLSLDAIKAHEYLATKLPIVATPASGFQRLEAAGLTVTQSDFADAVNRALNAGGEFHRSVVDWNVRATQFASALRARDEADPMESAAETSVQCE